MRIIGLTGSIGMGKSTLAKQLRSLGVPVHDADAVVHQLLSPNGAAFDPIKKAFPTVISGEGVIDRQKLGDIVFKDRDKRKLLESILHPLVRQSSDKFVRQCYRRRVAVCVLDIPLLFETGRDKHVDEIICVTAPSWVQERRVLSRPNMTSEKLKSIRAAQIPDLRKRQLSDYIIQTAKGLRYSRQAAEAIIRKI